MKKNTILFGGILLTAISFVMFFFSRDIRGEICSFNEWGCLDLYNLITIISFFGPALLVSFLGVFWVSEEVFWKWKKFTFFSALVYVSIIVLMPWSVGDAIAGFTKGTAGLVLSIIYLISSVVYILVLLRKGQK